MDGFDTIDNSSNVAAPAERPKPAAKKKPAAKPKASAMPTVGDFIGALGSMVTRDGATVEGLVEKARDKGVAFLVGDGFEPVAVVLTPEAYDAVMSARSK